MSTNLVLVLIRGYNVQGGGMSTNLVLALCAIIYNYLQLFTIIYKIYTCMTYGFVEGGDLFSGVEVAFVITRKPGMGAPISDLGHRSSKRH